MTNNDFYVRSLQIVNLKDYWFGTSHEEWNPYLIPRDGYIVFSSTIGYDNWTTLHVMYDGNIIAQRSVRNEQGQMHTMFVKKGCIAQPWVSSPYSTWSYCKYFAIN